MFIKTVEDILQPTLVLTIVKINPKIYKSKHGKQTPYASQTHFYHSKALPNYGALFVLYGAPLFFTTFFLNTNLKWIVGFIFYSLTVHIFISNSFVSVSTTTETGTCTPANSFVFSFIAETTCPMLTFSGARPGPSGGPADAFPPSTKSFIVVFPIESLVLFCSPLCFYDPYRIYRNCDRNRNCRFQ